MFDRVENNVSTNFMTIVRDGANGGNVGIGTTGPEAQLQIGSPYPGTTGVMPLVRFIGTPQSSTESTLLRLTRGVNAGPHYAGSADFKMKAYSDASNAPYTQLTLALKSGANLVETADVDVITFRDSGNVGIGTTGPSDLFHLYKTTSFSSYLQTNDTAGFIRHWFQLGNGTGTGGRRWNVGLRGDASNIFAFEVDTTGAGNWIKQLVIQPGGNVGIGTTGPFGRLSIYQAGDTARPLWVQSNSDLGSVGKYVGMAFAGNSGGSANTYIDAYTFANNDIGFRFGTNNPSATNLMVIKGSGNVGIGTTGPTTALTVKKLHASSYDSGVQMIDLKAAYPNYDEEAVKASIYAGTSNKYTLNTNGGYLAFLVNQSGYSGSGPSNLIEAMRIEKEGNVGIGTTGPSPADASSVTLQLKNKYILQPVIGTQAYIGYNMYYSGGSYWKYAASDFASGIRFNAYGNGISFHVAPSGIAGANDTTWDSSDIRMVINSSGNVGIGTTSPAYKLDVNSISSRLISNSYNGVTLEQLSYPSQGALIFSSDRTGYIFQIGNRRKSDNNFLPIITMYDTGNVGIGTTCPVTKLDLGGSGNIGLGVYSGVKTQYIGLYGSGGSFADNSGTGNIYFQTLSDGASNAVGFVTHHSGVSDTTRMYIDRDGNVGIGTTGPSVKLDVVGQGVKVNDLNGVIYLGNDADPSFIGRAGGANYHATGSSTGDLVIRTMPGYKFHIGTGTAAPDTVRLTIDTSGNVGIGTASPYDKLHVYEQGLRISNGAFGANGFVFEQNSSGHLDVTYKIPTSVYSNVMTLQYTGNVGIGTTGPAGTLTVKANTNGWDGGIDLISQDGSKTFKIHPENTAGYGLMFQSPQGFYTEGGDFRITGGNVGIGTTGPGARLSLGVTGTGRQLYTYESGNTVRGFGNDLPGGIGGGYEFDMFAPNASNGKIAFGTLSDDGAFTFSPKLSILPTGNVGIGTTGPSYKLTVASTGNDVLNIKGASSTANDPLAYFVDSATNYADLEVFSDATNAKIGPWLNKGLQFVTNVGTPTVTIQSNGNVGIGTTGPTTKLSVVNTGGGGESNYYQFS